MKSSQISAMVLLTVLIAVPFIHAADKQPQTGAVAGQFLLEGEIPEIKPLVLKRDPLVVDSAFVTRTIFDESLLVHPESKGIANVFVWLRKPPMNSEPVPVPKGEVTSRFDGCRLAPHSLIIRAGQTIRWQSEDRCVHAPHDHPVKNERGCIGAFDPKTFTQSYPNAETIPIPITCDVHSWERANWLVMDHPFAAITDAHGKFRIENLPAGKHVLASWHERCGWVERTIEVKVETGEVTQIGPYRVPVAKLRETK